jgi:hypothetical protein
MTQEFIPYQQALELKELGFDEPCFGYYYTLNGKDWNFAEKTEYSRLDDEMNIGGKFTISAPLYQQAFRWFREKHNIQGYIYSSTVRGNVEKTKQFTGYIWNINGIDIPFLSTDARDELHDTYEEAELACLIKLIEIVKTK